MNGDLVEVPFQGRTILMEYRWIRPERVDAPLIVFLHEGLGSLTMWKDYPQVLCEAGGFRSLMFSRFGYGRSTPRPRDEKWKVEFMHEQALDVLPEFLRAVGAGEEWPWLFGHSDGASIALIYAASYPDALSGAVVLAPHIFIEDITIHTIEIARWHYLNADLRQKLARYHADVDSAFWGWNDIWLNPEFRRWNIEGLLHAIRCPVLAVQGREDEYGSLTQIETLKRHVPHTELLTLASCGHSPHFDQQQPLTRAAVDFIHNHSRKADLPPAARSAPDELRRRRH